MSELIFPFGAALFGAAFQELIYWYDLRDRLTTRKYQLLLTSPTYWIISMLMMFGSAAGCILWKWPDLSHYTPFDWVIFGAAFPLIFKGVVRGVGITAKRQHLGRPNELQPSVENVAGWYFGGGS
jgi:hypothetical protein